MMSGEDEDDDEDEDENLTRSATTGAEGGRQASGGERALLAVGLRPQEPG